MNIQTNLFSGEPDARQEVTPVPSRFRRRYRKLTEEEIVLHDAIKDKAAELENLYNSVRSGRDRSLAFTHLEDSVMRIIREITG